MTNDGPVGQRSTCDVNDSTAGKYPGFPNQTVRNEEAFQMRGKTYSRTSSQWPPSSTPGVMKDIM